MKANPSESFRRHALIYLGLRRAYLVYAIIASMALSISIACSFPVLLSSISGLAGIFSTGHVITIPSNSGQVWSALVSSIVSSPAIWGGYLALFTVLLVNKLRGYLCNRLLYGIVPYAPVGSVRVICFSDGSGVQKEDWEIGGDTSIDSKLQPMTDLRTVQYLAYDHKGNLVLDSTRSN